MTPFLIFFLVLLLFVFYFFIRHQTRSRTRLERKLSEMDRELQKSFARLEEERSRLETTFSGMVEGVLLTDERGEMVHTNPSFREMFGLRGKVEGRSALQALSSVACDDAIREVLQKGNSTEREITFEKPKRRVFQVHFSPVRRDGKLTGVVSVFHDLTEIRRLEEVRRDFVANLSHELKTPLTAIRGYAETLLDECRGGLETRSYASGFQKSIEVIFRHSRQLEHLMENLLNLSRIESGKDEIALESIPLRTFVDHLLERFQAQAKVKEIELSNQIREEELLKADPSKLNQMLGNLVDNALKYTPEKGKIRIEGSARPGFYELAVEDTGPGIPEGERERIFERFYRLDKSRTRLSGGAGLGLAIVKHLAELHGGRVSAASGAGPGARFEISLPHS